MSPFRTAPALAASLFVTAALALVPVATRAACTGTTPSSVASCIDTGRLQTIVDDVTGVKLSGSPFWQDTQDTLAAELASYGYTVTLEPYVTGGVNVVGTLTGTEYPDQLVYITAHYDTIPDCPGANDNGAGLAAALELAAALAGTPNARTLVIVFFDEEEIGLIGAQAHVAGLAAPGDIQIVYNFDEFAYSDSTPNSQTLPFGFDLLFPEQAAELAANQFRGDFSILIGNEAAESRALLSEGQIETYGTQATTLIVPEALVDSPLLADLRRSDHAPFWFAGVPAIHITDGADFRNPNYHCLSGVDLPSTIDFDFATDITRGVAADAHRALNPVQVTCGLGPELAVLLPILVAARRRVARGAADG